MHLAAQLENAQRERQAALEMEKARQLAALQAGLAEGEDEAQLNENIYRFYMQQRLPQDVERDLSFGRLKRKPATEAEIKRLEEVISKADKDPGLTRLERSRVKMQAAMDRWRLMQDLIPEAKPSFQDVVESSMVPIDGGWIVSGRNGELMIRENPAAKMQHDAAMAVYKEQVSAWKSKKPDPQQFVKPSQLNPNLMVFDDAAYNSALDKWLAEEPKPVGLRFMPQEEPQATSTTAPPVESQSGSVKHSGYFGPPPDTHSQPPEPAPAEQQPVAELPWEGQGEPAEAQQAETVDINGIPHVVITDQSQIKSLPIGTRVVLPNGKTGVVRPVKKQAD